MDSLAKFTACMKALPVPIYCKDMEGRFLCCNEAFCDILNLAEEDIVGRTTEELEQPGVAGTYQEADRLLLEGKGVQNFEVRIPDHEGNLRDVQVMKNLVFDESTGEPSGTVGVVMDITDMVRIARKAKRFDRMKDIALEINQDIIQAENRSDIIGWLLEKCISSIPNAKFGAILILDEEGWLTIPSSKGYPDELVENFRVRLEDSFAYVEAGGMPEKLMVIEDIDKKHDVKSPEMLFINGESVKTSLVSPIWIDGKFFGFINIDSTKRHVFEDEDIEVMQYMRDQIQIVLSKQGMYQEKLRMMRMDYLTGAFNRRYFEELAVKNLELAKDSLQEISLAVMDIDCMKNINDTYGHLAGDTVLKVFCERMRGAIRGGDLLGRYGGDEFIVLFPGSGKGAVNLKLIEVLESMRKAPVIYEDRPVSLSFSFGVAQFGPDGEEYNHLVKSADHALYADKKRRKGCNP